jgi:hypothetical protein
MKIQWDYHKYHKMFIACNDIIITLSHSFNEFGSKNYIITRKPSLIIDDIQGILPLRLDRNDLDIPQLSFEKELLYDVSKDFIARLLMEQISLDKIEIFTFSPHNTQLLYSLNGYTLVSDYFVSSIANSYNLLAIRMHSSDEIYNLSLILKRTENYVIFPIRGDIDKNYDDLIEKTSDFILLSRNKMGKVAYFQFNHSGLCKQWENTEYVCYRTNNFERVLNVFDKESNCMPIMTAIGNDIQAIQEIPVGYLKEYMQYGGIVLNQLFEKYFGENIFIPYDMKERKKLYPLAFKELKDYMKDYE